MLALDEPSEDDQVIEQNGYKFCMEKTLVQQVGGVTINFTHMGFAVDPEIPLAGGGSCSTSGGCGGNCGS